MMLNAPFALDDENAVILNRINENRFGDMRPPTGVCRPGGPKEARLKRVALLSPTKEVDHLHPVKIRNIPRTASSEKLQNAFADFGDVGDVYIPTNLRNGRPKADFAVIRFHDKDAAEKALTESEKSLHLDGHDLKVVPLQRQRSKFSMGTGDLGLTNEAFDDGSRYKPKPNATQAISLESCMSRSGYPWGSVRELKYLAPHVAPHIDDMYSVRLENIPYYITPEDLRFHFQRYGEVGDVHCPKSLLVTQRTNNPNDGVAFVRFIDLRVAERAARDVNSGRLKIDDKVVSGRLVMPKYWPTEESRRYY